MNDVIHVTVGVPIYNEEVFLEQTLNSLAEQTYPNVKFLMMDNASTDKSEEICRARAKGDGRFRYMRRDRTVSPEENFYDILDRAESQYFMWSGAHDLWSPDWIALAMDAVRAAPGLSMVTGGAALIDRDNHEITAPLDEIDTRGMGAVGGYKKMMWSLHYCNGTHSLMNTDRMKRVIRILGRAAADHSILAGMTLLGEVRYLPQKLFFLREFRQNDNSYVRRRLSRLSENLDAPMDLAPAPAVYLRIRDQHLKLVTNAPLTPPERAHAIASTLLCFRRRWGVPIAYPARTWLKGLLRLTADAWDSPPKL